MWSKVDRENLEKKYSFSARNILKFYFRPCALSSSTTSSTVQGGSDETTKAETVFFAQVAEVAVKSIWRQDYIS